MNGFIYFLYTPPVLTRNYSAIAIPTFYNSLLHSHTGRVLVTELKHRNYNSRTELHISLLFTAALLQLTLNCTASRTELYSFMNMLGFSSSVHSSFCTTNKSSVNTDLVEQIIPISHIVTWMARAFLGNDLCATFSRVRYNNKTNVYRSLIGDSQRTNGLTRYHVTCFLCGLPHQQWNCVSYAVHAAAI
jgi:hypothetical protein